VALSKRTRDSHQSMSAFGVRADIGMVRLLVVGPPTDAASKTYCLMFGLIEFVMQEDRKCANV
jgi:hypothetical protein